MKINQLKIPHGDRVPNWMEPLYEWRKTGSVIVGYCLGFVKRKRDTVVIVGF